MDHPSHHMFTEVNLLTPSSLLNHPQALVEHWTRLQRQQHTPSSSQLGTESQNEAILMSSQREVSPLPLALSEGSEKTSDSNNDNTNDQDDVLVIDSEPPYTCQICGKVFAIPARLQRHYRVHTGEKPFSCEYCHKTFSVKENLNVHRRIHTKERPYECTVCGRAFEHSGKLHRHMRTHTGERPHKCGMCNKTFVQSGQLVIHMRAHTGEKPYTCEFCRKGFTCSKQLKVHIRTHTGEKPYECDQCGKTFGYNHVLKMHKMSHLGQRLYKCTICLQFFSSRKALEQHIREHDDSSKPDRKLPGQNGVKQLDEQSNYSKKRQTNPSLEIDELSKTQAAVRPSPWSRSDSVSQSTGYLSDDSGRGSSPISDTSPTSPPHSPGSYDHHPIPTSTRSSKLSRYQELLQKLYPRLYQPPTAFQDMIEEPQLMMFTTESGERVACPGNLLVRIDKQEADTGIQTQLMQELEDRLAQEVSKREREERFSNSVMRVLEALVGHDVMKRLGYPKASIDEVVMNILHAMNTQPCSEPSLAPMDRIKVNLRLLLECCVPDRSLWTTFGWQGKSIEDILTEFLEHC